jgi:hypothetical protein
MTTMARKKSMPKGKKGHQAHLTMGLPKGNPMAQGGNYGRRAGGRRVRAGRQAY